MNHQHQPSAVEKLIVSALDPTSTTVYYLANGVLIVLILTLLGLYFILESYHLLIMVFLAFGLMGSINFVWMNREDPNAKQNKARPRTKKKPRKE